jgi:hypothetical protein
VNFEAQPYQVLDDLLDLVFTCGFLHCNDHRKAAFSTQLSAFSQIVSSNQISYQHVISAELVTDC